MLTRRVALAALALIAAALVSVAPAAPPKDAMVIGLLAEPVTMDPPQISDLNSTRVIKRMFEGLTAQELGTYKIVPGLAEKWDISKDGLLYTFYLRPNVKFHDGTPLTAEAVKFCFEVKYDAQTFARHEAEMVAEIVAQGECEHGMSKALCTGPNHW